MSIPNFDHERLKAVLAKWLTPSAHITTPERLFGRIRKLDQIQRAFNSSGRHVFIYGDRGVGKTSLAVTAAHLEQYASEDPVYVVCGESSTFSSIMVSIGVNALPIKERMETQGSKAAFGFGVAGLGSANFTSEGKAIASFDPPRDINEAINVIKYINTRRKGVTVIVIDELARIKDPAEKKKIAEFVNSVSSVQDKSKFIFSGIGSTVEDLLGNHPSAARKIEAIELEKITHDQLWNIVQSVANELGVEVAREFLLRSGILSDGFPHYVHLIAENLFWAMHDDQKETSKTTLDHFKIAVRGALERSDVEHRSAYLQATQKTKNTIDYEMALWALADKTETRRQISSIYEDSYKKIKLQSGEGLTLNKSSLNNRLLNLRKSSHGEVVIGYGAGWFAFRENIMRGYVRLVAETRGISLAKDVAS